MLKVWFLTRFGTCPGGWWGAANVRRSENKNHFISISISCLNWIRQYNRIRYFPLVVKMKNRLPKISILRSRNRLKVSKFDFLPDLVHMCRLGGVKIKTNSVQFHLKFPVWTELGNKVEQGNCPWWLKWKADSQKYLF